MKRVFPFLLLAFAATVADARVSSLAGRNVLVIGDSHLVNMTAMLHDDLRANGAGSVHVLAVCGSVPSDWLATRQGVCGGSEQKDGESMRYFPSAATQPLSKLLEAERPDVLVVVLGENIAGHGQPAFDEAWAVRETNGLSDVIAASGVPCVWVGPTWGEDGGRFGKTNARERVLAGFLSAHVAPCIYVDSLGFSRPGNWKTKDGMHLVPESYRQWSAALARKVAALPLARKKNGSRP